MAERFTADLLFIVIVLLIAALLGFLIGYLLERGRCRKRIALKDEEIASLNAGIRKLQEEKNALTSKVNGLEDEKESLIREARRMDDEIASLRLTIDHLEKEAVTMKAAHDEALRARAENIVAGPSAEGSAHSTAAASRRDIRTDDLEVVVGIGPKIARLLITRGITTWKALADTSVMYLREILDKDGGERFRVHNPESWPQQAHLLHEGRFEEFRELENRLEEKKV